jgi:hypothetical protein
MKVRMLAVISILSLASWLPIQAQQPATPAQTPAATAPSDDTGKSPAKHACCCAAKSQAGQDAAASSDHHAAGCCHGKGMEAAKADCCEGKAAKDMPCCGKNEKADQAAMQCCAGKKDAPCPAKDGKSCCGNMNAKDGKGCCAGMAGQCPAHANGH